MAANFKIFFLIILAASIFLVYSESFENGTEDLPFLINPAKISENRDVSIGIKGNYSVIIKNIDFGIGISGYRNKKGFSFNYIRDSLNYYTTLFGMDYKKLLFGTKILFYGNSEWIKNSVSVSFLYNFEKINMKTGIIVDNVFKFDTTYNIKPLSINLTNLGYFPFLKKFYYELVFGGDIYSFYNKKYDIKASLVLQKFLFKNPVVFIYLNGNFIYNYNSVLNYNPEVEIGIKRTSKYFKYGLSLNGKYNSYNNNITAGVSLLVNPKIKKEVPKINITISGKDSYSGYIVSIKNSFSKENKIKRWVVFIYNEENKIIRTYNGMGVAPSTIVWNYRNGMDDIVVKGLYKIDMVIIDSINRKIKSNTLTYNVK